MRLVTVLVLVVVVAALAVVVLVGAGGWFRVQRQAPAGDPLLDLTEPDIRALTIEAHGRPAVELYRRGDGWAMAAPVRGPADALAVRRAVLALCNLRVSRTFRPADPHRPPTDQTGLGSPRLAATLTDLSGRRHVVKFGERQPLVRHLYAQLGTTHDFHLVDPDPTAELDRPFGDFREARLLDFDPADVCRITVTGREAYALVRTDGRWEMVGEGRPPAPADAARVRGLLDHLAGLEITAFAPEPAASLRAVGLDPPAATFLLKLDLPGPRAAAPTADDPTGPDHLLLAIGTHEGGVYVMAENDPWPMKIAPTALGPLLEPSETFRDRRIVPVEAEAIAQVTVGRGDLAVTLTRRAGRWTAPEGLALPPAQLDGLAAALTEPRIGDFITSYSTLRGFALDRPFICYAVTTADGTVWTLALGATDADERLYLQRGGDHAVIMARAAELATTAETLLAAAAAANRPAPAGEVPDTQPATP
ncbi:MAG: DUF4340 domain-containing protein [Planctomycetes bacterium]|nr:DUF4340 domain-containing protein [Planctomycetota bacterium]